MVVTVCERARCGSSIAAPRPGWPLLGDPPRVWGWTRGPEPWGHRRGGGERGGRGEGGAPGAPPGASPAAARAVRVRGAPGCSARGSRAARGSGRRRKPREGRPPGGRAGRRRPGGGEGAWRGAGARRAGEGPPRGGAADGQPLHLLPGMVRPGGRRVAAGVAGRTTRRAARRRGRGGPGRLPQLARLAPPPRAGRSADLSPSTWRRGWRYAATGRTRTLGAPRLREPAPARQQRPGVGW